MKIDNKILICGASIAGPTLAYWLQKYGYSVTIVEKAKALRTGGQNVDIKGLGQTVVQKMGIEAKIATKNTGEKGLEFVDASGKIVGRLPKDGPISLTSSYEILRGDLVNIIYEETKNSCIYRFGTFITNIYQKERAVTVTFNDGSSEDFELVICAEGLGSSTRKLVMNDKVRFRYLGVYMSFFRVPKRPEDSDLWARSYNCKGGAFIVLRPGHENETTALVTFPKKNIESPGDNPSNQKQILCKALAGAGGLADRILADLDYDHDLYFGPMSQIKASSWSLDRFALLGDSAYCPSPFTGRGTELALAGAYILAGEIKKNDTYNDAFKSYEEIFRPYVKNVQEELSSYSIRLVHPKSAIGIWALRSVMKVLGSKTMQKLSRKNGARQKNLAIDNFVLPEYS